VKTLRPLLTVIVLGLACACSGKPDGKTPTDAGPDRTGSDVVAPPDAVLDVVPTPETSTDDGGTEVDSEPAFQTVGEDLDEVSTRELSSSYELPEAFYGALEAMGLDLSSLFMPDIGLTADWDMSRLHWTDTIRHEGHLAPTFGYMVIEDIEAALETPDTLPAQALLIAQHTYNGRDEFTRVRYDEAVTVASGAEGLWAALQAFYVGTADGGDGADDWQAQRTKLEPAVDAFPSEAQTALAQAILGLMRAAELRDEALLSKGVLTLEEWGAQHQKIVKGGSPYDKSFLDGAHPGIDFDALSRASQLAMRSVESLRVALSSVPATEGAAFELTGPRGRLVVDLTDTANTWKYPDLFLLVDGAGNDLYYGRVAANVTIEQPISVVLDLRGDDTYAPGSQWEVNADTLTGYRLPMQGAGIFGVAILDDASGNDRYGCLTTCQGYGIYGTGVLVDHEGDDLYEGYDYAQGAAEFGYGLLLDLGDGADSYETLQRSQGYGGPRGIGWIVDQAGDDQYLAIEEPIIFDWAGEGTNFSGAQGFAFGWRAGPYWSGGLGGLFDLAGNDSYQCAVMCLGFGYFFGTGLFFDRTGDDSYVNTHKYTLGSATHQSVGLFVDGQGADTYTLVGDDEAIGLGYDHGVAYHIDRGEGDDVYSVENIGDFTLGFARHPALGTLINEAGNDQYHIAGTGDVTCGRSWVDANDRQGTLAKIITMALFLDLAGPADEYDIAREEVTNAGAWHQTEPLGGGWDPKLDFAYGWDLE
jgi:hypothetical protein